MVLKTPRNFFQGQSTRMQGFQQAAGTRLDSPLKVEMHVISRDLPKLQLPGLVQCAHANPVLLHPSISLRNSV